MATTEAGARTRRTEGGRARARRTQAERRAESDRRMLGAAAELIVERGIGGASMAEIGRRAGYSHGLVAQRFGSKDALVEQLNSDSVALFSATTAGAVGDARGLAALTTVVGVYLDLVQGPDPLARVHLVLWSEAIARSSGPRPYRTAWDRYFRDALAALVADAVHRGEVRPDVSAGAAAAAIVGLMRGIALQLVLDPRAEPSPGARELARRTVIAMLS